MYADRVLAQLIGIISFSYSVALKSKRNCEPQLVRLLGLNQNFTKRDIVALALPSFVLADPRLPCSLLTGLFVSLTADLST